MVQIYLQPGCGCGTYVFTTHDSLDSAPKKEEIEFTKSSLFLLSLQLWRVRSRLFT